MKKEYDFRKGKRGRVIPVPPGKTRITIRLDDDILEWFRRQADAAGGGSYQTVINHALRHYIEGQEQDLEKTLRGILREEFELIGLAPANAPNKAKPRIKGSPGR
jgi:hypothetical protein